MGMVYADIELSNAFDVEMVRRKLMDPAELTRVPVNILVDTGAYTLAINNHLRELLQLSFVGKEKVQLADGNFVFYDIVSAVEIRFSNRSCVCNALVLPGNAEPLLGAIPLEDMDLIIHPKTQTLVTHPDHGEDGIWKLKKTQKAYSNMPC